MIGLMIQQGFNWEKSNKAGGWYNSLKNLVADLADAGVINVWLPPPSQSTEQQGKNFLAIKFMEKQPIVFYLILLSHIH